MLALATAVGDLLLSSFWNPPNYSLSLGQTKTKTVMADLNKHTTARQQY